MILALFTRWTQLYCAGAVRGAAALFTFCSLWALKESRLAAAFSATAALRLRR